MTPEEFKAHLKSRIQTLPGATSYNKHYRLSIKASANGTNLFDYFTSRFPYINRNDWVEKIKQQNLKVNNLPIDLNYNLKTGDLVEHFTKIESEPEVNATF